MVIKTSIDDPFYHVLSRSASELGEPDALSLTDRRGDIIALVSRGDEASSLSHEELGFIQVYGQLALQHAPEPFELMSVGSRDRRWQSRSIDVDGDRYDLWLVWSTQQTTPLHYVEVELALEKLVDALIPLLRS